MHISRHQLITTTECPSVKSLWNQLWTLPLPSRSLRGYHSLRCVSAKCLTKPLWFSTLSAPALGQLASITSVDLLSCVTYNPSSLPPFTFRPSHLRPRWKSPLTQKWAPYQWVVQKPWTKMNQDPHSKLLPLHDLASDTVSMPFGLYSSISKTGTRRFSFDLQKITMPACCTTTKVSLLQVRCFPNLHP